MSKNSKDESKKAFNLDEKIDEFREKLGFKNNDALIVAGLIFLLLSGTCVRMYSDKEAYKNRAGELEGQVNGLKESLGKTKMSGLATGVLTGEVKALKAKHAKELAKAKAAQSSEIQKLKENLANLQKQLNQNQSVTSAKATNQIKGNIDGDRAKYFQKPAALSEGERSIYYRDPPKLDDQERKKYYKNQKQDTLKKSVDQIKALAGEAVKTQSGIKVDKGVDQKIDKLE